MRITTLLGTGLLLGALLPAAAAQAHGQSCAKPFQYAGTATLNVGYSGAIGEFSVPAGYRLQVEYVSAALRVNASTTRGAFAIGTWAGGAFGWHRLPMQTGYATTDRQTSLALPLYADANSLVKIEMNRSAGYETAATGRYTVTGCLFPAQ